MEIQVHSIIKIQPGVIDKRTFETKGNKPGSAENAWWDTDLLGKYRRGNTGWDFRRKIWFITERRSQFTCGEASTCLHKGGNKALA